MSSETTENIQPETSDLVIRPARPSDMDALAALIRELAVYEKLESQAVATPDDLEKGLFGPLKRAEALMLEVDGVNVGFAVYFHSFSTFTGKAGLYIEDIFIRPAFRRRGFGRMVFRQLARIAVAEGCARVEWSVLTWNTPALDFYASLGALPMNDWTIRRLSGPELIAFAKG